MFRSIMKNDAFRIETKSYGNFLDSYLLFQHGGTVLQSFYSIHFTLRYFFKHFDWMLKKFNHSKCLKNSVA